MAITYTWTIPQMKAYVESDGQDNVIFVVTYIYTGIEESGGQQYQDNNMGTQS
jgi:hypothetical protein